jgi:hypothetical protein
VLSERKYNLNKTKRN